MKFLIMSIVANGKATYAKELSKQMSLSFVELDSDVYHNVDVEIQADG